MKRALLLLPALILGIDAHAQGLVVEYETDFNRALRAEQLEIRTVNDLDIEEDGIPELVFIEADENGNQTRIRAFDGRTRAPKWEFDLSNIGGDGIPKYSSGASFTHRDSLIWRGFRRLRRISGLGKSKTGSERLAIFHGLQGGVLLVDPSTNEVVLDVGDGFVLLNVIDVDKDDLEEVLIGDKARRVVMVIGDGTITSVESGEPFVPAGFHLAQNYPNPFNPSTTIRFTLEKGGDVAIQVFNLVGQRVRTLLQSQKAPGAYSVVWDGKDDLGKQVATGHYYYQLVSGDLTETKKMLLLR